jgi:hypothetical protein
MASSYSMLNLGHYRSKLDDMMSASKPMMERLVKNLLKRLQRLAQEGEKSNAKSIPEEAPPFPQPTGGLL